MNARKSSIRRLNKMPSEREQIMEKVFQGALAVIARHKALQQEEQAAEPPPEARDARRAKKAVKQIETRLGTATITVLMKKNPHREGTQVFAQYELLRKCATVGEALQQGKATGLAGLTKWKLQWFEKQKIIKIG